MNKITAILLAAGKSERFGYDIPKPFLLLDKKSIFRYSLEILLKSPQIDDLIFIVPKNYLDSFEGLKQEFSKPIQVIEGGLTRFESVRNAINHLANSTEKVIIHDAARPFLSSKLINNCLDSLLDNNAVSTAIPSTDTLVSIDNDTKALVFPDRSKIYRIQTPQAFDLSLLKNAIAMTVSEKNFSFTDETSLIHHYKLAKIKLIDGSEENIKITHPLDLIIAEQILKKQNQ